MMMTLKHDTGPSGRTFNNQDPEYETGPGLSVFDYAEADVACNDKD